MGQLYESRLDDAYARIKALFDTHEPHDLASGPWTRCNHPGCGHEHQPQPDRCPGDACNDLFAAAYSVLDKLFLPEDAEKLLADTPEAWEWGTDGGWESVRQYVAETFRSDASERIFDAGQPTDPRTTVPSE